MSRHPDADLLATLAHELRGPLAALTTSSELLVADFEHLDPAQVRGMVAAMHRGALWLQGLVENLLCAASLRDGQLRLRLEPIQLASAVRTTQGLIAPLLARKQQRLRLKTRSRGGLVLADESRLCQVLMNLVLNASKFSPVGSIIDVYVSGGKRDASVSVSDRGPGLPDDQIGRLFDPFYRAATPALFDRQGVGLGLAIVKSLVEAHGGRVGAANRRGGGARFWLTLPIAALEPHDAVTSAAGRVPGIAEGSQ